MKVSVNLPWGISTVYKKKKLQFLWITGSKCISQQLISANSSLQEFYYPCPNRHDWFFRTLPCRNNVLVIHRLFWLFFSFFFFFVTKCYKKLLSRKCGDLGFSRWSFICPGGWDLFSRSLRKSRGPSAISAASQPSLQEAEFLPLPPGHPPARLVDHCPHGGTYPPLPPPGHPSPLWSAACLCFPFYTCLGDLSENQCKVGKKVAPLFWVPLVARVPARLPLGPLGDEELRTGTLRSQLAVVRAHLLTSRL